MRVAAHWEWWYTKLMMHGNATGSTASIISSHAVVTVHPLGQRAQLLNVEELLQGEAGRKTR